MKSLLQEIKQAIAKACTEPVIFKAPKAPRMSVIQQLIDAQEEPQDGIHFLKLDRAYLRCTKCRSYVLARTNESAFETFVGEVCHFGLLSPSEWAGHKSHRMQRQGMMAECLKCHARGRYVDGQNSVSKKLKDSCPGGSQDIRQLF